MVDNAQMSEADLLRFASAALDYSGLLWWRVPVGGVAQTIGRGRVIYKKSPIKGMPDLAIITKDGVLSVLELKTKVGRVSPEQKEWLANLAATNCNTCVARSPEEVLAYIERLGGLIKPKPPQK